MGSHSIYPKDFFDVYPVFLSANKIKSLRVLTVGINSPKLVSPCDGTFKISYWGGCDITRMPPAQSLKLWHCHNDGTSPYSANHLREGPLEVDWRILKAMRLMERGMGGNLRVEQVAERLGLSVYHFHRLFLTEVGEPPASFLRRIRMDAAALRLKWADEPAETIAQALGFSSRPAFIRAFTQRFGVSPARYRAQQRKYAAATGKVRSHRPGALDSGDGCSFGWKGDGT